MSVVGDNTYQSLPQTLLPHNVKLFLKVYGCGLYEREREREREREIKKESKTHQISLYILVSSWECSIKMNSHA